MKDKNIKNYRVLVIDNSGNENHYEEDIEHVNREVLIEEIKEVLIKQEEYLYHSAIGTDLTFYIDSKRRV